MSVIITPQSEIDSYFESSALGQSSLKKLLGGIDNFLANQDKGKELYYEEKDYFIIGSAVDTILTGEEGEFDKQYHVSKLVKKPSDAEMSIIQYIFDELVENNVEVDMPLDQYGEMILASVDYHNWQKKWKTETRVNKIALVGADYFEDLKLALDKQIITTEQKTLIDSIVMSLKTNARTSKYFDREQQGRNKHVNFYFQLPIYFSHKNIDCKALMDLVVVIKNDEGQVIAVEPVDLKTMSGNTLTFLSKVKWHRYDIQAAWYTMAVEYWLKNISQLRIADVCVIRDFTFVVESTTYPGTPLVYQLNSEMMEIGQYGRPAVKLVDTNLFADKRECDVTVVKEIKGFNQLIEEYLHYESVEWKEAKEITEAKGNPIMLSWEGIINN